MRNREAARYARWSAIGAGLIALAVAGVYAERAFRQARARHLAPVAVPVTVQQQSAQFSFSKVEQDRTIFTIRASRATQYKDQNRALLEDVWITVYGRDGSRNDNIHTRECSYEPDTGDVRCEGEVQIDVQNAAAAGAPAATPLSHLEVTTTNLSFNRNTGEASTPAPVQFKFPTGQGHGVGASYSTHDAIVRVEHDVEFDLAPSSQAGGMPVSATGSSLEFRRAEHTAVLKGPALVREGARELSADTISIELDSDYHARRAVAEGHPQIRTAEGGAKANVSAERFEAVLSPAGWIERIVADGDIAGTRQTSAGTDRFSAAHAEFAMLPQRNLIDAMTASGGVTAESQQGADWRSLKTDALRLTFSSKPSADKKSNGAVDQQHVESAETLSPATIESKSANDATTLHAKKFVAQFRPAGRLEKLLGHSGVEVRRQIGNAAPQTISAAELAATFDARGEWDTLDESGDVRFQQARSPGNRRPRAHRPLDGHDHARRIAGHFGFDEPHHGGRCGDQPEIGRSPRHGRRGVHLRRRPRREIPWASAPAQLTFRRTRSPAPSMRATWFTPGTRASGRENPCSMAIKSNSGATEKRCRLPDTWSLCSRKSQVLPWPSRASPPGPLLVQLRSRRFGRSSLPR